MIRLSAIELERLIKPKFGPQSPTSPKGKNKVNEQVAKLQAETKLHLHGLPAYVTEHRFHPTRRWRLDYAWPDMKIALEVHGGVRSGGRHTRGTGFTNDREKMNTAASMGWIIIEATADQIRNGQARAWLDTLFKQRGVTAA